MEKEQTLAPPKRFRLGIVGCGFWAHYQVAAWAELDVEIVAMCDSDLKKAQDLGQKFGIKYLYTDLDTMLESHTFEAIDLITSPPTHHDLVLRVAARGVPIICQKPMATDWNSAVEMVSFCREKQVPFFIHENFRWQSPMLRIKQLIDDQSIGALFKARLYFNSSFPVLQFQPTLAQMPEMIIADLGVHLFDLVRFFFGEVALVFCRTQQIGEGFVGENVANTFLETRSGVHCYVELSWASVVEYESFPQTLLYLEGTEGSIRLDKDFKLSLITREGIVEEVVPIPDYDWLHPDYRASQAALVACNRNLMEAILGQKESGNRADLNLETLRIVYAAYESARSERVVKIPTSP
jgi:D-apiose dehydrogenase